MIRLLKALAAAVVLAVIAVPGMASAQARWLRAESEHLIVYSDGDERVLRDYIIELETFDALLRAFHGVASRTPPRKLPIYLVRDSDALRRVAPGMSDEIGGFYSASVDSIYGVAIRTRGDDHVMKHEYVHHFLLQNGQRGYPAWLNEGYAEYFAPTQVGPRTVNFGLISEGRAHNLVELRWVPMTDLITKRSGELSTPEDRAMFYAQAWLLTHWFVADPARRAKLNDYLTAIRGGADPVAAMEAVTGMPMAQLERTLRTYLAGGVVTSNVAASSFRRPEVTVAPMSAGADAFLLTRERLGNSDAEAGAALLPQLRADQARWPDDPLGQLTLARGELEFGDRAAAEALLARRIEADANDTEALLLMAQARLKAREAEDADDQALTAEASGYLARVLQIDPGNYQALYQTAVARNGAAGFPSAQDAQTLMLAFNRAPQVAEIRLYAAQVLIARRIYPLAVTLLEPVANSPHAGPLVTAARSMLERARAEGG
ncbi:MAG TPA: DUF1570 domain-containing protein [Caulobacteraceae bacterium]|jgi:hypothetical protein